MNMNKIGLVFSHVFVRGEEKYKFDMIEYCAQKMREFDDFFIVLSGHGDKPAETFAYVFDEV